MQVTKCIIIAICKEDTHFVDRSIQSKEHFEICTTTQGCSYHVGR